MNDLETSILTKMGMQVYKNNPFLGKLAEFMEHPASREFYEKYMNTERTPSTLFFLWLYKQIEKEDPNLTPYKKLAILQHIMSTSTLRHLAYDKYHNSESENPTNLIQN